MKSWPLCATIILLCIFDIHETELPCSSSDEAMQIAKRAAPTLTAKFPLDGVGATCSLQRSPMYHLVYIQNNRARAPYTQSASADKIMRKQQKKTIDGPLTAQAVQPKQVPQPESMSK